MHNCRRTQNNLTDLIFDELPADQNRSFIADIQACGECARQYMSLIETLNLFDEAANATLPESENYWLAYNKRLGYRLNDSNALPSETRKEARRAASFWRRTLAKRVLIPIPVLAAAVLVAAASLASLLLLRFPAATRQGAKDSTANTRARSARVPAGSDNSSVENPLKIIEVPVVKERVVTRVVYLHRRQASERKSNEARSNNGSELLELEQQRLARAAAELPRAPLAQLSLNGFQPTNDVKLTVIKASEKDQ